MKKVAYVVTSLVALTLFACGGDKKPPPAAPTPAPTATEPTTVTSAQPKKEMAVNVDDAIVKACNLKFTNVEESPKFDFDSEQLTEGEKQVLDAIAKCL